MATPSFCSSRVRVASESPTLSAATAIWLADQGISTLLVSTDLQRSLSDLFERGIGGQETSIPEVPGLLVRETEPERLVREHWHQLAGAVQDAFGPSDVLELMSHEVSPCMMEMASFYLLLELYTSGAERFQAIVFDTAPGGRALVEIRLPFTLARRHPGDDPFAAFRAMPDAVVAEISRQESRTQEALRLLTDPAATVFIYVLWPESLPIAETERAIDELAGHGIHVPALIVNEVLPDFEVRRADTEYFWERWKMQRKHRATIDEKFSGRVIVEVPLSGWEIKGVPQLREIGRQLYSSNATSGGMSR